MVLTIREGFEEAWVRFAECGAVDAVYSGPYLTIAQQIADYNNTNYPGIPQRPQEVLRYRMMAPKSPQYPRTHWYPVPVL